MIITAQAPPTGFIAEPLTQGGTPAKGFDLCAVHCPDDAELNAGK